MQYEVYLSETLKNQGSYKDSSIRLAYCLLDFTLILQFFSTYISSLQPIQKDFPSRLHKEPLSGQLGIKDRPAQVL